MRIYRINNKYVYGKNRQNAVNIPYGTNAGQKTIGKRRASASRYIVRSKSTSNLSMAKFIVLYSFSSPKSLAKVYIRTRGSPLRLTG